MTPILRLLSLSMLLGVLSPSLGCSSDARPGAPPRPVSGAPSASADRVVATLLLEADELVLLDLRPASPNALPPPHAQEPALAWRFEDGKGKLLAEGHVTDPLLVRSELDESGAAAPVDVFAEAASFEVELANVGGIFTLAPSDAKGGTQPQSWGNAGKVLSVVIDKLLDSFLFRPLKSVTSGPTEQLAAPACTGFTILVVGDGYTLEERGKFEADVDTILAAMSSKPVYAENWKHVGVWRKFFASKQSGISDPKQGILRDTAFQVQHDWLTHRAIGMGLGAKRDALAKLARAKAESGADVTLVLANTSEYAGAARPWQRIGFASTHAQSGAVMGHELGHALFDLSDEYDYGFCFPMALQIFGGIGPNIALDLGSIPWSPLLTAGVELPTTGGDASTVGAYEGGLYCKSGVYRPQQNCFMRHNSADFCAVCASHVKARFAARTAGCATAEPCVHGECQTGAALSPVCGGCAAAVCAARPSCCEPGGAWDEACVGIAQSLTSVCRGVCADGQSTCGHDECVSGAALAASCSSCADSVCQKDPACCSGAWGSSCAARAAEDPFCVCFN
jgi:hypothetical protein